MGTDNGTTEALKITLDIDGLNDVHADILDDLWCENTLSEGQYDATKCFLDEDTSQSKIAGGSNADWTVTSGADGANYCLEKWTIATTSAAASVAWEERCTRLQLKTTRLF